MKNEWFVYVLRCSDDSLYTGIAKDLTKRLAEHNSAKGGAKYTKCRQPLRLVYSEPVASRSIACRREYVIKRLSRAAKIKLIGGLG